MERPTDNNQEFQTASSEDEVVRKQQNDTGGERQRESSAEGSACAPRHIYIEQATSDRGKRPGKLLEQVVRPKLGK